MRRRRNAPQARPSGRSSAVRYHFTFVPLRSPCIRWLSCKTPLNPHAAGGAPTLRRLCSIWPLVQRRFSPVKGRQQHRGHAVSSTGATPCCSTCASPKESKAAGCPVRSIFRCRSWTSRVSWSRASHPRGRSSRTVTSDGRRSRMAAGTLAKRGIQGDSFAPTAEIAAWKKDGPAGGEVRWPLGAPTITMYMTVTCPFCARAERYLGARGVTAISKIRIDLDPGVTDGDDANVPAAAPSPRSTSATCHVGGYEDLVALDHAGRTRVRCWAGAVWAEANRRRAARLAAAVRVKSRVCPHSEGTHHGRLPATPLPRPTTRLSSRSTRCTSRICRRMSRLAAVVQDEPSSRRSRLASAPAGSRSSPTCMSRAHLSRSPRRPATGRSFSSKPRRRDLHDCETPRPSTCSR